MIRACGVLVSILPCAVFASGQTSTSGASSAPAASQATAAQPFDVKAAVDTYLAKMPPAQRARSDA
jgi:chloramphenicol 3-O-phosphotransferase